MERVAAGLSGAATVFLSLGVAWYFGAAIWWLLRHDWPDWTWRDWTGPTFSGAGPVVQFLAGLSPGATALLAAAALALAARLVDPSRPRR